MPITGAPGVRPRVLPDVHRGEGIRTVDSVVPYS